MEKLEDLLTEILSELKKHNTLLEEQLAPSRHMKKVCMMNQEESKKCKEQLKEKEEHAKSKNGKVHPI